MVEGQMQAIPILETMYSAVVAIDLFIRLSKDKYIQIGKAGSSTPIEMIERYQAKGVETLWVRLTDYKRLIEESFLAASSVLQADNVSAASKANAIKEAMSSVYHDLTDIGVNDELMDRAKLVNHSTVQLVLKNTSLNDLVSKLGEARESSVQHSMMVSVISTMLGVAQGWASTQTLEKLALGGFLHDIGLTKLPQAIVTKSASSMTNDERIIYESHPEVGKQLLAQSRLVSDDVLSIVYEHHEYADGSGFPQGIRDVRINPMAKIVCIANAFVDGLQKEKAPYNENIAIRVIDDIEFHRSAHFNKPAFRALRRMLEADQELAAG